MTLKTEHESPTASAGQSLILPRGTANTDTVVGQLVAFLENLGVQHAFGVFGGGIAPFCRALQDSAIELVHFKHEAGAAFAAIEASLASDRLVIVLATTGPGLSNLCTGMLAARDEGAKVLFVSGVTSTASRGRYAFQETTGNGSFPSGFFEPGNVFHYAVVLESSEQLRPFYSAVERGVASPGGFVAHLGLPLNVQVQPGAALSSWPSLRLSAVHASRETVDGCAGRLASGSTVLWVGFGARRAPEAVLAVAERLGASVMVSPRGKGTFPESHPLFLGVTGLGGQDRVRRKLREQQPDRILVLGSRLGELTSFWSDDFVPRIEFIHVDVDAAAFGAAYPEVPTLGVIGEVGAFLEQLLPLLPPKSRPSYDLTWVEPVPDPRDELVRPSFLMHCLSEQLRRHAEMIVLAETGNSYAFASRHLVLDRPGVFRTSTRFASMGHACCGVLGAALATGRKAVAIVGDGALLMQNEMNTAATYDLDVLWIVLNDGGYRMIAQGMRSIGWEPFGTEFVRADFAAIGVAMGVSGRRVERESELESALASALTRRGPFVLDVLTDAREQAPNGSRNQSLLQQAVGVPALRQVSAETERS